MSRCPRRLTFCPFFFLPSFFLSFFLPILPLPRNGISLSRSRENDAIANARATTIGGRSASLCFTSHHFRFLPPHAVCVCLFLRLPLWFALRRPDPSPLVPALALSLSLSLSPSLPHPLALALTISRSLFLSPFYAFSFSFSLARANDTHFLICSCLSLVSTGDCFSCSHSRAKAGRSGDTRS
jgi:hypothetical protein